MLPFPRPRVLRGLWKFVLICVDIANTFLDRNGPYLAAAIAFYSLLSLVPLTLALMFVLGTFFEGSAALETRLALAVNTLVPVSRDTVAETVQTMGRTKSVTGPLGIIGLLWASTTVFGAIRKGVDTLWGVGQPRRFFHERLLDVAFTTGAGLLMVLPITFMAGMGVLEDFMSAFRTGSEGGDLLAATLLHALSPAISLMAFLVIYRYLPNAGPNAGHTFRDIWPGALMATAAFEAAKALFLWYTRTFPVHDTVYGPIGALVALLSWIYISAYILLLGALVTSRYSGTLSRKAEGAGRRVLAGIRSPWSPRTQLSKNVEAPKMIDLKSIFRLIAGATAVAVIALACNAAVSSPEPTSAPTSSPITTPPQGPAPSPTPTQEPGGGVSFVPSPTPTPSPLPSQEERVPQGTPGSTASPLPRGGERAPTATPTPAATPAPSTPAAPPPATVAQPTPTTEAQPTPAPEVIFRLPDIASVVEKVRPAVVSVVVKVGTQNFFGRETPRSQSGSGVIFDPEGLILTNNHVVENGEAITVTLDDGRQFDAEVLGTAPLTDLAVLKISGERFPAVPLADPTLVRVGDWVIAIGNALALPGGPTVTVGVVSALDRSFAVASNLRLYGLIQTNASINPGNSGGPLLNLNGEVVGINTAVARGAADGRIVEGIGFAVGMDTAVPAAQQLIDTGRVQWAYLGVMLRELDAEAAAETGIAVRDGVLTIEVVRDEPAWRGGIRQGDVIASLGGVKVSTVRDLIRLLRNVHKVGDTVEVNVFRDGLEITLEVTLGERPLG